jgi:hypothetical protein
MIPVGESQGAQFAETLNEQYQTVHKLIRLDETKEGGGVHHETGRGSIEF